jgi:hypothetical protein
MSVRDTFTRFRDGLRSSRISREKIGTRVMPPSRARAVRIIFFRFESMAKAQM